MLNNQHTPNAHVTIQSAGRMYLSTLKVKRGLKPATVIQSMGRMHVAKSSLKQNLKAAIVHIVVAFFLRGGVSPSNSITLRSPI